MARHRTLLRDFLRRSLVGEHAGYFATGETVNQLAPLQWRQLGGEAAYRRALQAAYEARPSRWLTPAEIFRPHYGSAVAEYLLAAHARWAPAEPLRIVEIGGGNGVAALDILERLRLAAPQRYRTCEYTMLEASELLAERQRGLLEHFHPGKVQVLLAEASALEQVLTPSSAPCCVVLLELLDNLPHDKVRLQAAEGRLEQAMVEDGPGRPREVFAPCSDPWIELVVEADETLTKRLDAALDTAAGVAWLPGGVRDLLFAPDHTATFLPTGAAMLLDSLCKLRPCHQLLVADFDHLPAPERAEDPSRVPDDGSLDAFDAPLVSGRVRNGEGVVDHHSYLLPTESHGSADIFFPVNFSALSNLYAGETYQALRALLIRWCTSPGSPRAWRCARFADGFEDQGLHAAVGGAGRRGHEDAGRVQSPLGRLPEYLFLLGGSDDVEFVGCLVTSCWTELAKASNRFLRNARRKWHTLESLFDPLARCPRMFQGRSMSSSTVLQFYGSTVLRF
eukprot:scaffold2325_cov257-Pinguiococcus_pyrenoidosus.AAC.11